jgi:hypothetical protein
MGPRNPRINVSKSIAVLLLKTTHYLYGSGSNDTALSLGIAARLIVMTRPLVSELVVRSLKLALVDHYQREEVPFIRSIEEAKQAGEVVREEGFQARQACANDACVHFEQTVTFSTRDNMRKKRSTHHQIKLTT